MTLALFLLSCRDVSTVKNIFLLITKKPTSKNKGTKARGDTTSTVRNIFLPITKKPTSENKGTKARGDTTRGDTTRGTTN